MERRTGETIKAIQIEKSRRSKRGSGTSKTLVSLASNSNSFPHSGAGQLALNLSLPGPRSDDSFTTTHVPHFGQVTHGHAMRSAIPELYGDLCRRHRSPGAALWTDSFYVSGL